jgi:class 3 adenylate cyclase
LAVRAGLALLEAVVALPAPERLQARVGIATGLVVVGNLAGASPEHEISSATAAASGVRISSALPASRNAATCWTWCRRCCV